MYFNLVGYTKYPTVELDYRFLNLKNLGLIEPYPKTNPIETFHTLVTILHFWTSKVHAIINC